MSGISASVTIPCSPETRDQLRDLKNSRNITYEWLLKEFLTLYGAPDAVQGFVYVRTPGRGDK
jgi:hypothetical protein